MHNFTARNASLMYHILFFEGLNDLLSQRIPNLMATNKLETSDENENPIGTLKTQLQEVRQALLLLLFSVCMQSKFVSVGFAWKKC